MKPAARAVAVALAVAVMLASAPPASAQSPAKPKRSAGTIVKWTLIGAAAGTGIGFMLGWKAYEKGPFAETKIGHATVAGGVVGLGAGMGIGYLRSTPKPKAAPAAFREWEQSARRAQDPLCFGAGRAIGADRSAARTAPGDAAGCRVSVWSAHSLTVSTTSPAPRDWITPASELRPRESPRGRRAPPE